jgi:hypothetical protein
MRPKPFGKRYREIEPATRRRLGIEHDQQILVAHQCLPAARIPRSISKDNAVAYPGAKPLPT